MRFRLQSVSLAIDVPGVGTSEAQRPYNNDPPALPLFASYERQCRRADRRRL